MHVCIYIVMCVYVYIYKQISHFPSNLGMAHPVFLTFKLSIQLFLLRVF